MSFKYRTNQGSGINSSLLAIIHKIIQVGQPMVFKKFS
jgi:hypothetical protein